MDLLWGDQRPLCGVSLKELNAGRPQAALRETLDVATGAAILQLNSCAWEIMIAVVCVNWSK